MTRLYHHQEMIDQEVIDQKMIDQEMIDQKMVDMEKLNINIWGDVNIMLNHPIFILLGLLYRFVGGCHETK